jgi:predicted O-methyltransferase YrrM
MNTNEVALYLDHYSTYRTQLFDLYSTRDAVLSPKYVPWTLLTTWGYWLSQWRDYRPAKERSAASIGEDEIKIFYDLSSIARPAVSYVIGNSFGLSTFALALANRDGVVVAIDNWSEPELGDANRALSEEIIKQTPFPNVRLYTGTSPTDTQAALTSVLHDRPLAFAFIDGLHRNEAAAADYRGLIPYLDRRSLVLWHNVNCVDQAFLESYDRHGRQLFDTAVVLRTHGPMGVFFSAAEHPKVMEYLRTNSLPWPEWERFIFVLEHEAFLKVELARRQSLAWKSLKMLISPFRYMVCMAKTVLSPKPTDSLLPKEKSNAAK